MGRDAGWLGGQGLKTEVWLLGLSGAIGATPGRPLCVCGGAGRHMGGVGKGGGEDGGSRGSPEEVEVRCQRGGRRWGAVFWTVWGSLPGD